MQKREARKSGIDPKNFKRMEDMDEDSRYAA